MNKHFTKQTKNFALSRELEEIVHFYRGVTSRKWTKFAHFVFTTFAQYCNKLYQTLSIYDFFSPHLGQNGPLSPSVIKSTATVMPVSTTDTIIHSKASTTATGVRDTEFEVSTMNVMSAQGSIYGMMKEPAESTGSCWKTFTVNAVPKELVVKPFNPVSKSLMSRGNGEKYLRDDRLRSIQEPVISERLVSNGNEFSKEFSRV